MTLYKHSLVPGCFCHRLALKQSCYRCPARLVVIDCLFFALSSVFQHVEKKIFDRNTSNKPLVWFYPFKQRIYVFLSFISDFWFDRGNERIT